MPTYPPHEAECLELFPDLEDDPGYQLLPSSHPLHPGHEEYNCIALAVGDTDSGRWDPDRTRRGTFWPPDISRNTLLATVLTLLERYCGCEPVVPINGAPNPPDATLAVYSKRHRFQHVAVRHEGLWISKLGDYPLVSHQHLEPLTHKYGLVTHFLRPANTPSVEESP